MEVKSTGLSDTWMRGWGDHPGNKVDNMRDCIMVSPFMGRGDVVEFSLRSKRVRLFFKDWILGNHKNTEVELSSGKYWYI